MGALPHCIPISPSLSCWPPTLQSRSHNTSASELAKADSALYQENPQFNSQSVPRTHGTARPPGLRSAAASLRASCHQQQNALPIPPTAGAPKKVNSILLGPSSALRGWHCSPVPHTQQGGPSPGTATALPALRLPARPPPRPGLLPAVPGVPEGSARGPASPPRPQLPYLEGPPERVEGTVQQQGGPAAAEQPQQLPEQHPSWAGGRGCGLRATWGGSRASRQQRRWLAPIPGARLSQL